MIIYFPGGQLSLPPIVYNQGPARRFMAENRRFMAEYFEPFTSSPNLSPVLAAKEFVKRNYKAATRMDKEVSESWRSIQDLIGDANTWPGWIRALFWSSDLKRTDRLKLAAFGYNNGVSPHVLAEFFSARRCDPKRIVEMIELYDYWDDDMSGLQRRAKYRSMDLITGRVTSLNGRLIEEERNLGLIE